MDIAGINSPSPSADLYQQVPVRTQYLEMTSPPTLPPLPDTLACVRWESPPNEEYLALYQTVGTPWGWTGRLLQDERTLAETLSSEHTRVYRIIERESNAVIGFFELDVRNPESVEIVYLGLKPDSLGKGYGGPLLHAAIASSWSDSPRRVWLHTCELDHPRALDVYRRAGFVQYDERIDMEYYPRTFLEERQKRGEQ